MTSTQPDSHIVYVNISDDDLTNFLANFFAEAVEELAHHLEMTDPEVPAPRILRDLAHFFRSHQWVGCTESSRHIH